MPSVVGCSLRRGGDRSARLMVHLVSAMIQLSSLARSWKELELETEGVSCRYGGSWWKGMRYVARKAVGDIGWCLGLYVRKGNAKSKW